MDSDANKKDLDNYFELIRTLYNETPTPPCIGCPFYDTCAEKKLSCSDFARYANNGTFPKDKNPKLRNPSFFWYFKTFLLPRTQPEL